MRKIVMFGFAAAMLASPAFADSKMSPPSTKVADNDAVVCHYIYHEGTIIRQKTCLTNNQWEFLRMQQQRDLATMEGKAFLHH